MVPTLLNGSSYKDDRGSLYYNNSFDASNIKRIYVIENIQNIFRRWQGHKIEQRWFSAIKGNFKIELMKIDNWDIPSKNLKKIVFDITDDSLDILHIPSGYVTSIQSMDRYSKLLVMADYRINEIQDEYRFATDYFI